MAEKIRFSEIRLDAVPSEEEIKSGIWTNPGHYTVNQAIKHLKMDKNSIATAIKACDLYIPLSGRYTGNMTSGSEITSEGAGPEDFDAEDLATLMADYDDTLAGNAIEGSKDYTKKRNTTINANHLTKAVGVKGAVWNLHELLTDPKATPRKIEPHEPEWKKMALENEADLIKTFLFLNGKYSEPSAIARPAFEVNGQLIMSDKAIPKDVLDSYMLVYFGEVAKFGRKWMVNSGREGANDRKSVYRRAAYFAQAIRMEASDLLGLTYYYSTMFTFLTEGFNEATFIDNVYDVNSDVIDGEKCDIKKGVFLQDNFLAFLSNPESFDMDMLENGTSELMHWAAKALITRFTRLKQALIAKGKREFRINNANSIEADSDKNNNTDEHSGSSKFERELYNSGNYTGSPEDAIMAEETMKGIYDGWNTVFTEYDDLLCEEVPGHMNAAPKLRYIIAMLSYPRATSTTIAYAVGTKEVGGKGLTGVNKEDTKYGASIEKGRIRAGNLIKISQDVVSILREVDQDVLDSFIYLINTPLSEAHEMRMKIIGMARKVFNSEYFPKDGPTPKEFNGLDLFNKNHIDPEGLDSQTSGARHNGWYLVDSNYVRHNQSYWEKSGHSFDEPEYEDVIDCLNDYTDAIVPVPVLPAIKKMAAEIDTAQAAADKAAKERAIAREKAQNEEDISAAFNGMTPYGDDGEGEDLAAVNESIKKTMTRLFEEVYSSRKEVSTTALFEEIRAEAKKAAKENK